MTDLRRLLTHGDPLAEDGGLSDAELRDMRRRIVSAASEASDRLHPSTLVLAAIPALLVVALGAGLHRAYTRVDPALPPAYARTAGADGPAQTVRRLYFQTPGGTRVFWLLTPEGDGEQK